MDNRHNYYRILHVQKDAPNAVIRASYRAMMQKLKYHPDLGGDEGNATVINEAYNTLTNKHKRARYDELLKNNASNNTKTSESYSTSAQTGKNIQPVLNITCNEQQCPFCGTDIPGNSHPHASSDCTMCNSPLASSTNHLQSPDSSNFPFERRLQNAPLKYFTEAQKPAQIGVLRDLSPLGLQFQLSEPLEQNQVIKLVCDALTAIVRVRNCVESPADGLYVVGVEFLTSRFNQRRGTFFSEAVC